MTLAPERDRPVSSVIYPGGARRTFTPLKMWACIGACCLGMWAFTWTVWFADGKATPTPTGLTEVPWWMVASIRFFEVGGLLSTVLFIYYFLVNPGGENAESRTTGCCCSPSCRCTSRIPY